MLPNTIAWPGIGECILIERLRENYGVSVRSTDAHKKALKAAAARDLEFHGPIFSCIKGLVIGQEPPFCWFRACFEWSMQLPAGGHLNVGRLGLNSPRQQLRMRSPRRSPT